MQEHELTRLAEIDRSERVPVCHAVRDDGQLAAEPLDWDVLPWLSSGIWDHTVRHQIAFCMQHVRDNGGILFGAFEESRLVDVALLRPHVSARQPGTSPTGDRHATLDRVPDPGP
jgi:hypothetical protein